MSSLRKHSELSAGLLVGTISDYRTPESHPENPHGTQSMHPCLLVEKRENRVSYGITITRVSSLGIFVPRDWESRSKIAVPSRHPRPP